MPQTGALTDTRIIDFGHYIAGPLLGQLLADQGATVIKVDPTSGPRFDTPANATWNRGKQSIALDLKTDDGRDTAARLLASADVCIENFRPGVMDRLGLGPHAMTAANPRLIYCSLPGFAADDPRAAAPAWEGVVGAAAATYRSSLGGVHDHPIYTPIPIASGYAALLGAVSVAMALSARERDGHGQTIQIPLYDAMFHAVGLSGLKVVDGPPRAARGTPWVRQYECQDGRWVQFHAAFTRFIHQFIDAAGVGHWREDGVTDRRAIRDDPALAADLLDRMTALFKTRPAQEWEDLVNAAGTPTAITRPSREWIDHPHARGSEMVVELDDPQLGPMRQPGIQARLSATPGAVRGPAPTLDTDRAAILAGLNGAIPTPPPGPDDLRAVLDGVRVLDLCIILAGPTCGRTLAEFGADVIKIDGPSREDGVLFHHDVNRGKRSILLDLKTEPGRDVFWRLVDQADVVVQNYRKGVTDRLGIGYDAVRARKPDIVYASLNAYGHVGPWADRPGWEQLAQACTGMQERFGGDGPPVLQPYAINDYGTGIAGAYAVALALLHKQRTGEGQHVDTALSYTACTLQSLFFHDYEGKVWNEARGQTAVGDGPLHRAYQAADGWLFLGARESDLPALAGVPGLDGLPQDPAAAESFLEARLPGAPVDVWVPRLLAAGAGAHRCTTVDEIMDDPWAIGHGLSLTRDHEDYGRIRTNGPAPRLSRTPVRPGAPASPPGLDAPSVLAEIGLQDRLADLVAEGALVIDGVPAL